MTLPLLSQNENRRKSTVEETGQRLQQLPHYVSARRENPIGTMSDSQTSPFSGVFSQAAIVCFKRKRGRDTGVRLTLAEDEDVSPVESQEKEGPLEAIDNRHRQIFDERKEYNMVNRAKEAESSTNGEKKRKVTHMKEKKCTLEACAKELGKLCCNDAHIS